MKQFSKILLIFLVIFTSCKSNKSAVGANIKNISTKKIINNHYNSNFNQKTIDAKINAKFKDDKTSVGFSIKLRLEKDKTIWMSATKFGFPVAKVMITPNRVLYYEKMKRTFFDGDFSLLSEWLGTELDYEKVQNILLGQAVLNLKKGKYNSTITNKLYQLQPKKDVALFDILFFLNSDNFKINKQEISNKEKQQLLTVSYSDYTKIKGEEFPKSINIKALDHKKITTIDIEYRTVEFNKDLTFPFSIPNGYKEISLK